MFASGGPGLTMIGRAFRPAILAVLCAVALLGLVQASAAAEQNTDGLPLPRFATTRSSPINVRVGPGQKYDLAWIFTKPGTPIEIVAEFDIWRKIRDFDGSEGWIQENLLSGSRAGLIAPWKKAVNVPLQASASTDSGVRAYLGSGFRVDIRKCDGAWCQVDATSHDDASHTATYSGYVKQSDIWGVYEGEIF
jgi:SH3-like domain-containing protein